jgi:hypothetical protein
MAPGERRQVGSDLVEDFKDDEFLFDFPMWIVVKATGFERGVGGARLTRELPNAIAQAAYKGYRCLHLFTDEDLARRYIAGTGIETMDSFAVRSPAQLAAILKAVRVDGFAGVLIDPNPGVSAVYKSLNGILTIIEAEPML